MFFNSYSGLAEMSQCHVIRNWPLLLGVCIVVLLTKCHVPNSYDSLVWAVAILLVCILKKKLHVSEIRVISKILLPPAI
jgi:hypothetical protein